MAEVDPYLELRVMAESLADMQNTRIRVGNRSGAYMRETAKSNVGPTDHTAMESFKKVFDNAEEITRKELVAAYRRVVPPRVQSWVRDTPGLGEATMARLLGVVGNPRVATPKHWEATGKPAKTKVDTEVRAVTERAKVLVSDDSYDRTVSQLWSYCGVGDASRKKVRGMSQEEAFKLGNPKAKMLAWLIATSCIKNSKGPYRKVYDEARKRYTNRVHASECIRCGPSGKPAQPGSPWNLGHQHAAAIRKVAKEVLKDLWVMAG